MADGHISDRTDHFSPWHRDPRTAGRDLHPARVVKPDAAQARRSIAQGCPVRRRDISNGVESQAAAAADRERNQLCGANPHDGACAGDAGGNRRRPPLAIGPGGLLRSPADHRTLRRRLELGCSDPARRGDGRRASRHYDTTDGRDRDDAVGGLHHDRCNGRCRRMCGVFRLGHPVRLAIAGSTCFWVWRTAAPI